MYSSNCHAMNRLGLRCNQAVEVLYRVLTSSSKCETWGRKKLRRERQSSIQEWKRRKLNLDNVAIKLKNTITISYCLQIQFQKVLVFFLHMYVTMWVQYKTFKCMLLTTWMPINILFLFVKIFLMGILGIIGRGTQTKFLSFNIYEVDKIREYSLMNCTLLNYFTGNYNNKHSWKSVFTVIFKY